jgi:hypothetical protein
MGKSTGCVLILAGLAVAAYALYPEPQAGTEIAAAHSARAGADEAAAPIISKVADATIAGGTAQNADPAGAPPPDEASKAPPVPSAATGKSENRDKSGQPAPAIVPPKHVVPPVPVPAKRPRTAVAAVTVDETPPRMPVGEVKTTSPPLDRAALTREIQRQLKRVGCYQGDVTGIWSPGVRQAMRAFTERANATLPVDGPDPVLLAMVQSHAPGACSAACPQGQDRAANGRCVPSALVAAAKGGGKGDTKVAKASTDTAAKKRPGRAPTVGSVAADASATTAPPTAYRSKDAVKDERMSLSGPRAAGAAQAKARPGRQAKVAGWSHSVQGRPRVRRAQRPTTYKGYSGLPSWALPFLMP